MDELRGRGSAVEAELSRLREASAVRRTGMHETLQAYGRILGELRQTQLEQGQVLAAQGSALKGIAEALDGLAVQLGALTGKVGRGRIPAPDPRD